MVKFISKDDTLKCRNREGYEKSEKLKNMTTISVSPKSYSPEPRLGDNLISMEYDLLASGSNPRLIIFMLTLPKMMSPYLK